MTDPATQTLETDPPILSYQLALASDLDLEGEHPKGCDMVRVLRGRLRCELLVPGPNPLWQRGTLRDDMIAYNSSSLVAGGGNAAETIETADSSPWWDEGTDYRYGLFVNAAGERSVWLLTSSGCAPGLEQGLDGPLPFPAVTYTLFESRVKPESFPLPAAITVGQDQENGATVVWLGGKQSEWAVAQDGRVRAGFEGNLYLEMRKSDRQQPGNKDVLYGIVLQKQKDLPEPTVTGVWGAESGGGSGGGD